jgi:F0F1-type ATP synthase delta subunit
MFSGGDDGKTFVIDVKSGKLVFTLPAHVDTINDIAFSPNGNWVATASYDRKISLFNIATMNPKGKLKAHAAPVMKLLFLGHNRMVSSDKNSKVIIWDVQAAKVLERLNGVHDDVTQIATDHENRFLFIGTALGYILLYDLNTYELLSKKYIKLTSSITALTFNADTNELIIGTEEGLLHSYNIYEGEEELNELLKQKAFTAIQKAAEINPILVHTKIYGLVANMWETTLKKAKLFLQKGDKKTAIALFKHFKNIPSKNKIIQKVMLEYEEFSKFETLAKQGKLPLAYGIVNKYPSYKDSSIYKALEKNWRKAFAQAQKYALQPRGTDQAKEILSPYRGISDKTKLIQELLTQGEVYKRFRVAIGQKEFKICFELIKQHPFLKEFPEYTTIMDYGDTLYIKSQQFIAAGDTHSAIKMLRILHDFADFKEEVQELMQDIENKQKFFNAVKEEDINLAYNLLSAAEELYDTDDGKRLHKEWNDDLAVANEQAVQGNSKGVEMAFNKYMKVNSKAPSIGTVFGWCYMVQLENAIKAKEDQFDIENGIKNYMLSFGLQDQIENLFNIFKKRYPESKLLLESLTKGSLSMWRPAMIVDSILD